MDVGLSNHCNKTNFWIFFLQDNDTKSIVYSRWALSPWQKHVVINLYVACTFQMSKYKWCIFNTLINDPSKFMQKVLILWNLTWVMRSFDCSNKRASVNIVCRWHFSIHLVLFDDVSRKVQNNYYVVAFKGKYIVIGGKCFISHSLVSNTFSWSNLINFLMNFFFNEFLFLKAFIHFVFCPEFWAHSKSKQAKLGDWQGLPMLYPWLWQNLKYWQYFSG